MQKLEKLQRKQMMYNISLMVAEVIIAFLIVVIPTVSYLSSSETARKFLKKTSSAISGLRIKKRGKISTPSFFNKLLGKKEINRETIVTNENLFAAV